MASVTQTVLAEMAGCEGRTEWMGCWMWAEGERSMSRREAPVLGPG